MSGELVHFDEDMSLRSKLTHEAEDTRVVARSSVTKVLNATHGRLPPCGWSIDKPIRRSVELNQPPRPRSRRREECHQGEDLRGACPVADQRDPCRSAWTRTRGRTAATTVIVLTTTVTRQSPHTARSTSHIKN